MYNKLVIKSNAIDTKISNTSRLLTKRKEKKVADVDKKIKRYLTVLDWSKRLITTLKLQRLKTKYLALLV